MTEERDIQNPEYEYRIKGDRTYPISPFLQAYLVRFHRIAKSTYPLPNDEEEHKRLDNLQLLDRMAHVAIYSYGYPATSCI